MKEKKEFTYDVCIIGGCGHVGLPLGISFAEQDKKVLLFDINADSVKMINDGKMPFLEENADVLLKKVIDTKALRATTEKKVISESEHVVVVIGTPVDEHHNPRIHDVMNAIEEIIDDLRDGQLLILRSTLYPEVTNKITDYLQKKNKNIDVAFCPERIAEGFALKEIKELPQIVSGDSKRAIERAKKLFSTLTEEVLETGTTEAELAKLFTNSWRYITFAAANQFYMIANSYGLDFYEIHRVMTHNYPRLKGFPKPGFAAGPCLFKDTMQIAAFSNNNFTLGQAAMLVNEGLPNYIVEQLRAHTDLKKKTVGILGMAFKANSDDKRESLSYKLKKILELEVEKTICSDVYIQDPSFVSEEELIENADIIILGVPHKEYFALDYKEKKIVDIWNFFNNGANIKEIIK